MNTRHQPRQTPGEFEEILRQKDAEIQKQDAEIQKLRAQLEAKKQKQKLSPTLSQFPKQPESQPESQPAGPRQDAMSRRNTFHGNNPVFRKPQPVPIPGPGPGSGSGPSNHYSHDASVTKRPRTYTQSSAPPAGMARSRSTSGSIPFTGAPIQGPRLLFQSCLSQDQSNTALERFSRIDVDDPFTTLVPRHQTASVIPACGETPDEYLSKLGADNFSEDVAPPRQQLLPPSFAVSPLTDTQTCPTLSPQPSVFSSPADNVSLSGTYSMMRIQSSTSMPSDQDVQGTTELSSSYKSTLGKRPRFDDASVAQMGSAPSLQQVPIPDTPDQLAAATSHPMSRNGTSTSMRSNASRLSDRAKETLSLQNQRAEITPLQPKPSQPKEGHPSSSRAGAVGSKRKEAAGKNTYHRPHHPRVYCKRCEEYPEGFRGEHELRRHTDAKHAQRVAKWVCCDGGPTSEIQPEFPIDKCKACLAKKQYGAYYNAAAHLRRAHFNKSKKSTRKGSKGAETEDPNRPGGQEWPPMEDFKKFGWFYKVWVDIDGRAAVASQASLEDLGARDDGMMPFDSQQPVPSEMSSVTDFAKIGSKWYTNTDPFGLAAVSDMPSYNYDISVETGMEEAHNSSPTTISPSLNSLSIFTPISDLPGYELSSNMSGSGNSMPEAMDMAVTLVPNSFDEGWMFGDPDNDGDQNVIFTN